MLPTNDLKCGSILLFHGFSWFYAFVRFPDLRRLYLFTVDALLPF